MSETPTTAPSVVTPGRAALLIAMAAVFMGASWPMLRIAMESITPLWFATTRMFIAGVVLAAFLAARGRLVVPSRRDMPMMLSLGLLQFGVMAILVAYGVSIVGAGRTAMLVYTITIWVTLGSIVFYGEKPSRAQVVGILFGIGGLIVLFSPLGLDWNNRRVLIGNGCAVLGAIAWSVPLLQVRRHRWHADPLHLLPYETILGALLSLPFAMIFESPVPHIAWNTDFVLSYAFIVIPATNFSFWALVTAGRRLPPIALSLAQLATPVIGVISASLMIAEIPSWADIAGLALIVCGVAVGVIFGRARGAKAPAAAR